MILTLATSHRPATDLGYLLHKNPDRHHVAELSFGTAHVLFYPEATEDRCDAAVLLEIDPIGLVRGGHRQRPARSRLAQYVNDRPYAASSFLSVALAKLFGTALSGRSKERPELAAQAIPLEIGAAGGALPGRRAAAAPAVRAARLPGDGHADRRLTRSSPSWGDSRYLAVTLTGHGSTAATCSSTCSSCCPVLDDDKHYWVGADEVDKLLRRGGPVARPRTRSGS